MACLTLRRRPGGCLGLYLANPLHTAHHHCEDVIIRYPLHRRCGERITVIGMNNYQGDPYVTNHMTIDNFFQLYRSKAPDNPLKHEYLKAVMIAAIEDGHWRDGDKLPTEQVAEITPFSLGTIQKAVGSLVSEGYVQRKRGRGTFIIPREKRLGEPWIFQKYQSGSPAFLQKPNINSMVHGGPASGRRPRYAHRR